MSNTPRRRPRSTPTEATWNAEYRESQAIPSSDRLQPSRALTRLLKDISLDSLTNALDVGCGNGRNAIFLAEQGLDVTAVDFAGAALETAHKNIESHAVADRVTLHEADVTSGIPLPDDAVDLVVDSYVSCHFLDEAELEAYFAEVRRVLRPEGYVYWSALTPEDEYYRQHQETHPAPQVVVDPLNDVPKRLYTEAELTETIGNLAGTDIPISVEVFSVPDVVDGTEYQRSILAGLLTAR
jgi:SAM-dependent methyltransferase